MRGPAFEDVKGDLMHVTEVKAFNYTRGNMVTEEKPPAEGSGGLERKDGL